LLAVAVLSTIFVGVLSMCLAPLIVQRTSSQQPDLTNLFGAVRRPDDLPGSPQSVASPDVQEPPALLGEDALAQNARAPFVALGPAARPFRFSGTLPERINARACLAAAMVYEAGDDAIGQLAVGQVILNRVRHPAFPASVCGVVTQGSNRSTGCQFTFTCDGSLARNIALPARARALAHADLMLDGMVFAGVGLATHYHTIGVYPWWSPRLEKIARVGSHLFFRWPEFWGSSRVFVADRHVTEPSAALFAQFASLLGSGSPGSSPAERQVALSITSDIADTGSIAAQDAASAQAGSGDSLARVAHVPEARRLSGGYRDPQQPSFLSVPALQGVRLLRMFPDEGVFYLLLTPGSTVAAHKRAAEQLCGGRPECQVYGWWSADAVPRAAQLIAKSHVGAAFAFTRTVDPKARSRPPSAITM
jgi:spore germination cell wall hydrolase CwlJ-like protein